MGFTVTRPDGTTDAAFQAYARLLRQMGKDLGRLPRVPEPGTGRRWLYAWSTKEEAQAFADALRQRTHDPSWEVVRVQAPASEGPLGPAVIQLVRQADGLTFGLHPLSRATIRSAFPQTINPATSVTIDTPTWQDFRRTRGDLAELVREIAPSLTGLSREQLAALGYAVVDADTDKTLVSVPPAVDAQG
jgi:hypothetical protein